MVDQPALAIVVPAYKARFLGEALRSIAAQTDRRYRLYVCDDASPEDLEAIFRAAALPADAVFHRIEQNVGGRSLVESWRRSVALSGEPWVWLFSDDDTMHPECVASFYQALQKDQDAFHVYRFNTLVINAGGQVIRIHPPNPELESVEEFIYHRLTVQRMSLAPEHIFRREAYERRGGFVDMPFGLGSDDATWINVVGEDTLFRTIAGPRVCWRLSGSNISSYSEGYTQKLLGLLTYAAWLYRRPGGGELLTVDGRPTTFRRHDLIQSWFLGNLHRAPHFFPPSEVQTLVEAVARIGVPAKRALFYLLRSNFFFLLDRSRGMHKPAGS